MAVLLNFPYLELNDQDGNPLSGGKLYTFEAGTTTPKATYTDNTENTPLANPVILDAAGRAVVWGSGSYKIEVRDSNDALIRTVDNITTFSTSSGSVIPSANAAGTVDAITADYTPNISLVDKATVSFTSSGANTSTTPTFAPDGNTARTIVKSGGQALAAGNIGAVGSVHLLQYDLANTRWELLNPVDSIASQAEAEAGVDNTKIMTPLRTKQSVAANSTILSTAQNTTSGTFIDFTSIPSTAKVVTVNFLNVSTSGTSNLLIQLGDSGGIETTSYVSTAQSGSSSNTSTAGFTVTQGNTAPNAASGSITISLVESSTNSWVLSGNLLTPSSTVTNSAGSKALSATLDKLRITTVGGTDTFDAGTINISYR
jgi:hypothetical protein